MDSGTLVAMGFVFVAIVILLKTAIVVPQQNGFVVERLGKYSRTMNAGFHILFPFIERVAYKHTLKEQAIDIDEQICITRDNVQVGVDGVLYMQVLDPSRASYASLYHIAGPAPVNLWDTIADLLRRLGHEPPVRRLSTRKAMRAANFLEVGWRLLGRSGEPPLTRYKVALLAFSQTLDTTRAQRELGFEPQVSITAGLDSVVRAHMDVLRSVGLT